MEFKTLQEHLGPVVNVERLKDRQVVFREWSEGSACSIPMRVISVEHDLDEDVVFIDFERGEKDYVGSNDNEGE